MFGTGSGRFRDGARSGERGLTRVDVVALIVVGMAVFCVAGPQLVEAEQRAKQVQTIKDLKNMGRAMQDFYTDYGGYPAAIFSGDPAKTWLKVKDKQGFESIVPDLIQSLPQKDGWGSPFNFVSGPDEKGSNTFMKEGVSTHCCLYSFGADGKAGSSEKGSGSGADVARSWCSQKSAAGTVLPKSRCYQTDIIFADGGFLQVPDGPQKEC